MVNIISTHTKPTIEEQMSYFRRKQKQKWYHFCACARETLSKIDPKRPNVKNTEEYSYKQVFPNACITHTHTHYIYIYIYIETLTVRSAKRCHGEMDL